MTNKTIRQAFVERLMSVGVILINARYGEADPVTGKTPPSINADTETLALLTDEQFAELDAAISDIEFQAKVGLMGEFTEVASPGKGDAIPSADQFVEWLNKSVEHPLRVTPDAVALYVEAIRDQGRAQQRRAGLNDDGEVPELILPNVNAVNVTLDEGRNMFVEVDGRNRLTLGEIDRLVIKAGGNRYVVLRDGDPVEALPDTPGSAIDDGGVAPLDI